MTDLAGAAQQLVDELLAGGVTGATLDSRNVNPPSVRVLAPDLAYRFGKGCWDATWTLVAVVSDSGAPSSYRNLGQLLDQVQSALGGKVVTATSVDVLTEDAGTLPGYRLTFTQRIPA